jgi:hypothetical protein
MNTLHVLYSPPVSNDDNKIKEKSKYRKGSKYDNWGREKYGDVRWESMPESEKDEYIRYTQSIINDDIEFKKQQKKALIDKKKADTEKRIIEKQGGIEYIIAKKGHLKIKRKKQMKQWKQGSSFDKRKPIIQAITKRKKGKLNSSIVGMGITKVLYPIKPKKKGRW